MEVSLEAHLTLMNARARQQSPASASLAAAGDQLYVDFDISRPTFPPAAG